MAPDRLEAVDRSPLTRLHLLVGILCAVGFAIDFIDVAIGGALSAVFSAPPHALRGAQLSWLLAASNAGAIVGAPLIGWIADRVGPGRALAWTVTWLALTTALAAASPDAAWLTAARFLCGVALGGYPPLMMAYLTDLLPGKRRGALVFMVCAIAYLAPPAAIFATRALTVTTPLGLEGWRWVLWATGVAGGLCALAWRWAPEAPRWMLMRGREVQARIVEARLERSRPLLRARGETSISLKSRPISSAPATAQPSRSPTLTTVVGLMLLYFLIGGVTVTFPLITGPLLLARHFTLSDTLFYVGLATFGPVVGAMFGGLVTDRIGRLPIMAVCAVVLLVSVITFFWTRGVLATACSLIAFGISTTLFMPAMTLYAAELFRPAIRGRATSVAWACNRVGATLAPLLFLGLVRGGEALTVIICLSAALGASLMLTVGLARAGKAAAGDLSAAPIGAPRGRMS
jgi:putative MFS transporter